MSVNYRICGNLAFFKLIGVVLLNIYGIFTGSVCIITITVSMTTGQDIWMTGSIRWIIWASGIRPCWIWPTGVKRGLRPCPPR